MSKVFVVDDNPAVAETLTLLLQTEGIPAEAIMSGFGAYSRIEETPPTLLIMDLLMPYNGVILLERIAARSEWTFPIVVLSGWEDMLEPRLAWRVSGMLPKTVHPRELLAKVRELLCLPET